MIVRDRAAVMGIIVIVGGGREVIKSQRFKKIKIRLWLAEHASMHQYCGFKLRFEVSTWRPLCLPDIGHEKALSVDEKQQSQV